MVEINTYEDDGEQHYEQPEHFREDTENAPEFTDDELEETWYFYVTKYVNSDMEGLDLIHLDGLEAEMFAREWTILVTPDRQDVDRNGGT